MIFYVNSLLAKNLKENVDLFFQNEIKIAQNLLFSRILIGALIVNLGIKSIEK